MEGWTKALLVAAGAAGVAGVLYYLLREEPEAKFVPQEDKEKKVRVEDVTKEQVRQILSEIVEQQEKMKAHMKKLTRELLDKRMAFDQTYERVKAVQPEDPLEKYGLSMMDFDQLLNKHQTDPQVREGIARIMGVPDNAGPAQGSTVPAKRVIEVHAFMLEELEKLLGHFNTIKEKGTYDMKTVTLAAQAVVGAKVEEKFHLTSEDIERAVIKHHTTLATDQEFASVNMKMQHTMALLMGAEGSG